MIFELYTAYPPSVNNYYVKTQRGVFISQKGKKFRDQLIMDAHEQLDGMLDRKSTRLNSSHSAKSRMPSSA